MTNQKNTPIQAAWDSIAAGYDEFVTPRWALSQDALDRAGLRPGMRFLDVACGSGALSIPAARRGAHVLAVDLSPAMIQRLSARARKEGLTNLEGRVMDGHALELPEKPGEAQQVLNIEEEGSYILSVKNPEKPSPRRAGLSEERQAEFPKELQERFGGERFGSADPPDYLDFEGAEILLVGAKEDISRELGIELSPEDESESSAEVFKDLRLQKSRHPVKPLLKGRLV